MLNVNQLISLLEKCVTLTNLDPSSNQLPIFSMLTQLTQELRSASTKEQQLTILKQLKPLVRGGMGSLGDILLFPPNSTSEQRRTLNFKMSELATQLYIEVNHFVK